METEPRSDRSRLAAEVAAAWVNFQLALSDKRKYPDVEFRAFADATRRYVAATRHDALINWKVERAVHGLVEVLRLERKRVPEQVLWEAERLECLLFSGYDPHFEGDEPPGLQFPQSPLFGNYARSTGGTGTMSGLGETAIQTRVDCLGMKAEVNSPDRGDSRHPVTVFVSRVFG